MLQWKEHPILKPPSDDELLAMEPAELVELHRTYHSAISNADKDPYRYGFELPHWKRVDETLAADDEALILGGNRSGKTEYSARAVVKAAVDNPDSEIFCFAQNAKVSVRQQQRAVWRYLPSEYKRKILGAVTNISYTKKNGFTDGSLILPNGSQIIFLYYSQFQQDDTILEGAELGSAEPTGINIGAWLDEYLGGPALIDTLRNRLATRDAKMLVTFTPIRGWTEVVRTYLDGAKTIASAEAELLNGELVPTIQKSKHRNAHVHYFHSINNPFGGYERLKRNLVGKDRITVLVRAYGVPTKSYTTVFPKFSTAVNVMTREQTADFLKGDVTRYQVIDPAGRKNWFMNWIAVDSTGCWLIYREWPGVEIGDWAEPGENEDWKPGEGARGMGYGLKAYIEEVFSLEGKRLPANQETWESADEWIGGEQIAERLIDPRLGAAKYQKADGDSSIIEDLNDLDFIVIPAPGDNIEDGLQKINDRLDYDTSKPIDGLNRPMLLISEDCENTIAAYGNYTGAGGKDEAWKDPIDCSRYPACAEIEHIPAGQTASTYAGAGGY